MAHPTALKKPCCTAAPTVKATSTYVPKGTDASVDDLIVYETANCQSKRVLICAYDIFGFHPNTKEVCDRLAEEGDFFVVMPDFYRGDYWHEGRPVQLMYSWFNYQCSWDDTTKKDMLKVIAHYKAKGATSFGVFGFCWGGKMSVLSGIELDDIKCIGLVHPSGVKIEEANRLKCPVVILPTAEEINFIPFMNKMIDRLGENACVLCKFDDMLHGFCAARGDFSDPKVRAAVNKVIDHLNMFFNCHMPKDDNHSIVVTAAPTAAVTRCANPNVKRAPGEGKTTLKEF